MSGKSMVFSILGLLISCLLNLEIRLDKTFYYDSNMIAFMTSSFMFSFTLISCLCFDIWETFKWVHNSRHGFYMLNSIFYIKIRSKRRWSNQAFYKLFSALACCHRHSRNAARWSSIQRTFPWQYHETALCAPGCWFNWFSVTRFNGLQCSAKVKSREACRDWSFQDKLDQVRT